MTTTRDVRIKDVEGEVFKLVVQTVHQTAVGTVWANTAVHDQIFARRIGGVRFVKSAPPGDSPEDLTELGELAEAMGWKSPLSGIPADGQKTVVYTPNGLPSQNQMAEILADHLKELAKADPGVIFGPDINCNEVVMQRLADAHGAGDHVSGLLQGRGGLSIDGQGYTARGVEAALVATADRLGWKLAGMRCVVQGFGAVGAHTARNLRKHGVVVHAVSTVHGALVADTTEGLDTEELFADWQTCREENRPDDAFRKFLQSPPKGARVVDKNQIWSEPAEIFIPAARTDVLGTPEEVKEMRSTMASEVMDIACFVEKTGARIVVEGANHPLTDAAESYLESHAVYILPDYLINCGGLIGCWADWVYRRELEGQGKEGAEWFERLNARAPEYVSRIVKENIPLVFDITGNSPKGMREATRELARKKRRQIDLKYAEFIKNARRAEARDFARSCMDDLLL